MEGLNKIEDLVGEIKRGGLILPDFQRGYVWGRSQVREYLTSLYRGYPTGSLIIWRTTEPGKVRGAPHEDFRYYSLILDGQQRLTTIFTLLEGQLPPFYQGAQPFPDLWMNLAEEKFSFFKASETKFPDWVRVTDVFQKGAAEFVEGDDPLTKEQRMRRTTVLTQLFDVRKYVYYCREVREQSIETVVRIFDLVNSSGTRLSTSDLALAQIGARWPDARGKFQAARTRLAMSGFDFDLNFFTRCTAVAATDSADYDRLRDLGQEALIAAWDRTEKAIDYAVTVLKGNAFIDSSDDLASEVALVPLVYHLSRSGGTFTSDAERRAFQYWLYAALMWGRYSGASETALQSDIKIIADKKGDAPRVLVQNILEQRGRIRVDPADLVKATGERSGFTKMAYIVARANGGQDWGTGAPLYEKAAGKGAPLELHHIFPRARLFKTMFDRTKADDRAVVNQLANLAFLRKDSNWNIGTQEPATYLPKILRDWPKALEHQFVPPQPALWTTAQFASFLEARRRLIADAINNHMDELVADVPGRKLATVQDLIDLGEGPQIEFKGSLRWDFREERENRKLEDPVLKTICAFLNTRGGTLVIGVLDNGTIVGLDRDFDVLGIGTATGISDLQRQDKYRLHIRNLVHDRLGPEVGPFVEVNFSSMPNVGYTVAVVHADAVFHGVRMDGKFFIRSDNTSIALEEDKIATYLRNRPLQPFGPVFDPR